MCSVPDNYKSDLAAVSSLAVMSDPRPAADVPLQWEEGRLVMQDSVENWRLLANLMMSREQIEEVTNSADKERRRMEQEESRLRPPRQTQEESIAQLNHDISMCQLNCAYSVLILLGVAACLDCLGVTALADTALLLSMTALVAFATGQMTKIWIWVYLRF